MFQYLDIPQTYEMIGQLYDKVGKYYKDVK